MNKETCDLCGAKLVIGPNATNKRFCSTKCYKAWWDEQRFTSATQESRIERQLGPAPELNYTEGQAMWLACAIDGEGSIGIFRQTSNDRKRPRYRPMIGISNTNLEFLGAVSRLVNERVVLKNNPTQPHHKKCWTVWIGARAIPKVLTQIRPHLIIKRKQADLVMEFCRAVAASPVHNREMQPTFERLYTECKMLNKRGRK